MLKIVSEVYSRVSGYYRPVSQWNKGKRAEWDDREMLKLPTYRASTRNFNTRGEVDAHKETSNVSS